MNSQKQDTIGIVVLGDVGRSPRMQYHAYSLTKSGCKVKILGYNETKTSGSLLHNVEIINVSQPPTFSTTFPKTFHFVFKALWTCISLFYALLLNGRYHVLLVQNPPAIPTLAVCWIYSLLFRAKLIIDWHNYAYTILALNVGDDHTLVKISKSYERFFGRLAANNICVTKAMADDLKNNWNISAVTLYDKPGPTMKSTISSEERSDLFRKLSKIDVRFSKLVNESQVGLLVSSTSWTPDEDFLILLRALTDYDQDIRDDLPQLICVITGKGPLKDYYIRLICEREWKKVSIITPWLEAEDYPRLLVCADLGVCLHTSSSGLDLPMKIVDMFGAGLPVCAYNYPCLSELVQHNENGLLFENSNELAQHLKSWFQNFPAEKSVGQKFRQNIKHFQQIDWCLNWNENVSSLFK